MFKTRGGVKGHLNNIKKNALLDEEGFPNQVDVSDNPNKNILAKSFFIFWGGVKSPV